MSAKYSNLKDLLYWGGLFLYFTKKKVIFNKSFDNKTLVKIYPNPFSHEATFEIENGHFTEGGHFELYDAVGHRLRRERINGNQFVFQREALMSGFYFFRILDGNKFVASGKIVVEWLKLSLVRFKYLTKKIGIIYLLE